MLRKESAEQYQLQYPRLHPHVRQQKLTNNRLISLHMLCGTKGRFDRLVHQPKRPKAPPLPVNGKTTNGLRQPSSGASVVAVVKRHTPHNKRNKPSQSILPTTDS